MTIQRTVTFEELQKLVGDVGRKAPAAMRVAMQAAVQAMLRDVVKNRMSGQYLGVVTGTGRRSVQASGSVSGSGDALRGVIGSPLGYIRAHERGFSGPVQVRAHTRRRAALETRRGKATKKSAAAVKARLRAGRSGYAHVRAHTRQVNIRARRFLRDTVLQEAGSLPGLLGGGGDAPFTRRAVRALQILAITGKLPKVKELGLGGG